MQPHNTQSSSGTEMVFDAIDGVFNLLNKLNNFSFFNNTSAKKTNHIATNNREPKEKILRISFEELVENPSGLCGDIQIRENIKELIATHQYDKIFIEADIRKSPQGNHIVFSPLFNNRGVLMDGAFSSLICHACGDDLAMKVRFFLKPTPELQPTTQQNTHSI